jgi:hypothetical protein
MLMVDGSSSDVMELLTLYVLEMPKPTVIPPWFSSYLNADG